MTRTPLAVISISGPALGGPSTPEQEREVARVCAAVAALVQRGWRAVPTHGLGPRAGVLAHRPAPSAAEEKHAPAAKVTAATQGAMGFLFQKAFAGEFRRSGLARQAVAVITQVLVERADPSILENGVHAPLPQQVLELPLISDLVEKDRVVICCGGGGIPVAWNVDRELEGIEAILDQDRSSALLARSLAADAFVLCGEQRAVLVRPGTPEEKRLGLVPASEARALLQRGEFGAGGAGPKVQAALDYLAGNANAGARAVIGGFDDLAGLIEGTAGTRLVP